MPGYSVFRQDRQKRQRGGVCLFLRDDLTGEVLESMSNGVCELLIVRIHQLDTVVIVVYRPPDTTKREFSPVLRVIKETLGNLSAPAPNIVL